MAKLTDVEFMYYCPACGYECGHVIGVSELDDGMYGNGHSVHYKSGGAIIHLECEGCGYQSKIIFGDHKGNVYITVRGDIYLKTHNDELEKQEVWFDIPSVIKKDFYRN